MTTSASSLQTNLTDLLSLHGQLQAAKSVLSQTPSATDEMIDLSSSSHFMSWPDLGVTLACHGFQIDMSKLQTYFLQTFSAYEVSHSDLSRQLGDLQKVKVVDFAKAMCLEIKMHFARQDAAKAVVQHYGRIGLEKNRLGEIAVELGFRDSAAAIVALLAESVEIAPVEKSGYSSRKSSQGLLGIHSNGFSIGLEKDSNSHSKELVLQAKKSSQHIINTHGRGEYVAIQHLRMRTNRILDIISNLGVTKSL